MFKNQKFASQIFVIIISNLDPRVWPFLRLYPDRRIDLESSSLASVVSRTPSSCNLKAILLGFWGFGVYRDLQKMTGLQVVGKRVYRFKNHLGILLNLAPKTVTFENVPFKLYQEDELKYKDPETMTDDFG